MKHVLSLLLVAGLWSAFPVSRAVGQHNPDGQISLAGMADPYLLLLHDPVVHSELRLRAEQRRAITALTDELDGPLWTLRTLPNDRAGPLFQELVTKAEGRTTEILQDAQRKRLAQMRLAVPGVRALARDEVAAQLKLSEGQREQIKTILDEKPEPAPDKNGEKPRPGSKPIQDDAGSRVWALLSNEQRARVRDLFGTPLEVSQLGRIKLKAPELDGRGGWLNTPPLTMAQLRGKVIALHFWTYG